MNCERYQEFVSQFADGELQGAGESEMFAHLRGCATCRAFFRTAMQVRLSVVRDTSTVVPESLDSRVNLIDDRSPARQPAALLRWKELFTRRLLVPAPVFAAAIILLVVSLGAFVATLTIRSEERAQMASGANYIMLLPEVEVRGIYQAPSQNIH